MLTQQEIHKLNYRADGKLRKKIRYCPKLEAKREQRLNNIVKPRHVGTNRVGLSGIIATKIDVDESIIKDNTFHFLIGDEKRDLEKLKTMSPELINIILKKNNIKI